MANLDLTGLRVVGGRGQTLVERDAVVRALARQMARLDVADSGLCFGRLDSLAGERLYIGRIGLLDEENDYDTLLLDWRATSTPSTAEIS